MSVIPELLARVPGKFSTELGIEVHAGAAERQKWFLAAILFGAPISGTLAARTYRVFAARGVLTPDAVLAQGWDNLVALLDEGGYTRYDFKTATKLLRVMETLKERIGPTTAQIFLRELRGVWPQADPPLSSLARLAAEHLGLLPSGLDSRAALAALQEKWRTEAVAGCDFADLEAALVRLGRDFCRKPARWPDCPMSRFCGKS